MPRHPVLYVNHQLSGRGTLEVVYEGHQLEIELARRYALLLIVLFMADREDRRNRRIPSQRGYRTQDEIRWMIARLPGNPLLTVREEVVGKVFGLRCELRKAFEAAGLPPLGRHDLIESETGRGYRLGRLGLEVRGWSPDDAGATPAPVPGPAPAPAP